MKNNNFVDYILMAQAVVISLIESYEAIEPCEIKSNLYAINSLLIDASTQPSSNEPEENKTDNYFHAKDMLENIHTELLENTSLLEAIFKYAGADSRTDNAMACLIRSMQKTTSTTQKYIESICDQGLNSQENKECMQLKK